MALPTPDVEVKVAGEIAQRFLDDYFEALNRRANLESFYVNSSPKYTTVKADISINGLVVPMPADFQALIEKQGHGITYDVESFDAHCINPNFNLDCPEHLQGPDATGAKASVLVNVVGRVRYGRGKDAPQQNFTEVFVLVPNWDLFSPNPPRRRRLIMSQNFRAL